MALIPVLLMVLSASLAATKNILVKGLTGFSMKNREFFGVQAVIFAVGSAVLLIINAFDFNGVSLSTFLCGLAYGVILIGAQWFYTLALMQGKTAVCATLYSFGFVVPTLSGMIFWNERVSVFGIIGILIVFPVLIISGKGKKGEGNGSKKYIFYLIIALLCSGGVGIVQKVHQKTEFAQQKNAMVLIAFMLGFFVSSVFYLFMKSGETRIYRRHLGVCAGVGSLYAVCNCLNTFLAGALPSAIFFPVLNILSIVTSMMLGLIVYRERLTRKDILVLALGAVAIVFVNL